ncbi:kynurenine formamidase-like [Achroia grisella]|uniref:kynurenine formamidase-like n=1 Tax=Achroia grisella TaxID=688607 RepID=UPI0027D2188E|nr:kynurenine formamidase-like [Achroia grisella]
MATLSLVLVFISYFFINCFAKRDSLNDLLFSGGYDFIDLTHSFDNQTVYWPNAQRFQFTNQIADFDSTGSWYAANDFKAGEHGGTHIDAPYHFTKSGQRVGELPLTKLIASLIIVDISAVVNDDPNFVLYKTHLDHLLYYEDKPSLLIFKFGWSKYFNDTKKYLGQTENDNTLNFPSLSDEVAEWITSAYKNVVGIGVDVASVDPGRSTDFAVHKILARSGLYSVENVNLLRRVPETGCTAFALPMKIALGTGAPLRLVAICPTQERI